MATMQEMERALVNAYNAGDMDATRALATAISQARQQGGGSVDAAAQAYEQSMAAARAAEERSRAGAPPPQPPPSLGQQALGAAETALALGTGAVGGTAGFVGGTVVGMGREIARDILSGRSGTREAQQLVDAAAQGGAPMSMGDRARANQPEAMASMRRVFQTAQQGARALTYEPRTATGREMTQEAGQFLGEALPPVLPIIGAPGTAMAAARQAAPVARQAAIAAAPVAQAVVAAPTRAAQAVGRAVGIGEAARPAATAATAGRASTGAAATPLELQRFAEAEMAGLRLSEGEMKRDPELLAVEKEQAKTPGIQGPYLQRQQENNQAALRNLEQVLDSTGAETGDLAGTGIRVVDTLMSGWRGEKAKTDALYTKFRESPEAQAPVDVSPIVAYLNSQPRGVSGITGVPDTARQNAVALGIVAEGPDGTLVSGAGTTLGRLEEFRQSVSAISAGNPNDKRLAVELKRTIDAIGGPIGGEMTRAMRAQRQRQAQKYENRAIVARLLLQKKGMDDAQTPVEDVFQKTILGARPSEITHIKRVLSTIPDEEGKQAWSELQGATVRHLLTQAESGIGADNLPVISGAKLDRALRAFDQNGKLDLVMGKAAAEQIRTLNQVLKYIQSTPPLTSINNSGTARTIINLMAESLAQGALVGVQLPILQGAKMLRDNIKDRRTRERITQALNYRPEGVRPARQSTGATP